MATITKSRTSGGLFANNYRLGLLIYQIILGFFLVVLAAIIIVPLLYVFAVSFTDPMVYDPNKFVLWPERWSIDAYRYLLAGRGFMLSLSASVFITFVGTPLTLMVTATFAYVLSKPRLPGRKPLLMMVLFTMLFSPGMIPAYLLIRSLGLIDSWWALILPGLTNAWSLLVMKSFYQTIPTELEDAAKIDGCSDMGVFFRIVLPLSTAALAAFTLFFAVGYWNIYFSAIIYLNDASKWPLQVMLQQMVIASNASRFLDSAAVTQLQLQRAIPPETVKMAAVVIVTAPIVVVYPFLQKHFAKGVLIGSVKE
jgi:putative aldouronate transport system permease protein